MLKVARQNEFHLNMALSFKSHWKQDMKEIPYCWIFESFDFELIDACEIFPKDD
jgi:hypothetical protein